MLYVVILVSLIPLACCASLAREIIRTVGRLERKTRLFQARIRRLSRHSEPSPVADQGNSTIG
jgi:hypothetical protein